MAKKKSAAHGKNRQASKRSGRHANPEMDVLQERFESMEVDFSSLASMLGQQQ